MRLTCPECSAAYEVSPILLAGRQAVRCARCGHQWSSPTTEERALVPVPVEESPPDEPEPAPARTRTADDWSGEWEDRHWPQRRRAGAGLWFAWLLTFVVIGIAAWAAVAFRGEVMRNWPPSTRAYAAVGLTAPTAAPPNHPSPKAGAPATP